MDISVCTSTDSRLSSDHFRSSCSSRERPLSGDELMILRTHSHTHERGAGWTHTASLLCTTGCQKASWVGGYFGAKRKHHNALVTDSPHQNNLCFKDKTTYIQDITFAIILHFTVICCNKYLGVTVTNTNEIREEIKRRIIMENARYYSLQKILSSCLLLKKLKVNT